MNRWTLPVAALSGILLVTGCNKPVQPTALSVADGVSVTMHYTLTVDGNVLDTSVGKTPLTFVQGSGQIIPGLGEALVGLKKGEKKNVTVSPDKGYGLPNPQAVQKVPKKSFKDAANIKPGAVVTGDAGGRPFQARVTAVDAEFVTLDLNHPLAGKTLNFEVEVVDVQPAAATAAAPAPAPAPAQPQG